VKPVQESSCKNCGRTIIWANNPDGTRHRPLERAQHGRGIAVSIDEDGFVRSLRELFIYHVCSADF
jgi:hypothetical protein